MESKEEKKSFWYAHIEAWERGFLSQEAYCKEEVISFTSFGYWRKRYNREIKSSKPTFVEATSKQEVTNKPSTPAIQILLPNGVRLGIEHQTSMTMLQSILQMVSTC